MVLQVRIYCLIQHFSSHPLDPILTIPLPILTYMNYASLSSRWCPHSAGTGIQLPSWILLHCSPRFLQICKANILHLTSILKTRNNRHKSLTDAIVPFSEYRLLKYANWSLHVKLSFKFNLEAQTSIREASRHNIDRISHTMWIDYEKILCFCTHYQKSAKVELDLGTDALYITYSMSAPVKTNLSSRKLEIQINAISILSLQKRNIPKVMWYGLFIV